jgi:hypothetical protein
MPPMPGHKNQDWINAATRRRVHVIVGILGVAVAAKLDECVTEDGIDGVIERS